MDKRILQLVIGILALVLFAEVARCANGAEVVPCCDAIGAGTSTGSTQDSAFDSTKTPYSVRDAVQICEVLPKLDGCKKIMRYWRTTEPQRLSDMKAIVKSVADAIAE